MGSTTTLNLLFESCVVGIYCATLYQVFILFAINKYDSDWKNIVFLFVFGFVKHALGALSGLQDLWFQYRSNHSHTNHTTFYYEKIAITSIMEGIAFVAFGSGLLYLFPKLFPSFNSTYFFTLGFLMHLGAQWTGIHKQYVKLMYKH